MGRRVVEGGQERGQRMERSSQMEDSRKEERRADGGVDRGMRVERKREKIREVEPRWRGNRLSCSPGKGDLFVSVGLCYSPDVSIIGL